MRVFALALAASLVALPAATAGTSSSKILVRSGNRVVIVYLGSPLRQPINPPNKGALGWSGDGRILSIGGTIVGRAHLPATQLVWAPTGERAAYVTAKGGVVVWTPDGRRVAVPDGWGAIDWAPQSIAWSANGSLAIGRLVCHGACGRAQHKEIWIWRDGSLRRLLGPLPADDTPLPFAWSHGRVLWWDWPGSGSVASDGVAVYANTKKIADALMYRDFVAVCGQHLAIAEGGDRFSTHGKRILFDGRDVSRNTYYSWVSPSCTPSGRLVAAAGRDHEGIFGREHRAIWQLLPTRRQLTRPPRGWTDEDPHLLPDGSLVFVRTRWTSRKVSGGWQSTQKGKVELLAGGTLKEIAGTSFTQSELQTGYPLNFYGHYDWTHFVAVTP